MTSKVVIAEATIGEGDMFTLLVCGKPQVIDHMGWLRVSKTCSHQPWYQGSPLLWLPNTDSPQSDTISQGQPPAKVATKQSSTCQILTTCCVICVFTWWAHIHYPSVIWRLMISPVRVGIINMWSCHLHSRTITQHFYSSFMAVLPEKTLCINFEPKLAGSSHFRQGTCLSHPRSWILSTIHRIKTH